CKGLLRRGLLDIFSASVLVEQCPPVATCTKPDRFLIDFTNKCSPLCSPGHSYYNTSTHIYGYTHLSAGDLLRDGKIVPFEITIKLLKKAMEETRKLDEKKIHFLIDGFPRNKENLHGWTTIMDGEADVKFVLYFDCRNEDPGLPAVNMARHLTV
uniref:Nucleoside-diphosphate kinase n=1 Tax=Oncorhynchus tshawytscha TaxID=74940 RepID=A0A8C8J1M4_ONCTS